MYSFQFVNLISSCKIQIFVPSQHFNDQFQIKISFVARNRSVRSFFKAIVNVNQLK